jgi:hypothetical protein
LFTTFRHNIQKVETFRLENPLYWLMDWSLP